MQVTPAYLSSVATFYDMLRTTPAGSRYVYVCTSVACHVRNARAVYQAIEEEAGAQGLEDVDLREFECLGACDMAPMASIDGRYVGPLGTDDAAELVRQLKAGETVMPGRGLEDPGFSLPEPSPQPTGETEHPKVEPAGGAWPEADDQDVPPVEDER
jgi:NADH-quinone oxidoreductase subunit E